MIVFAGVIKIILLILILIVSIWSTITAMKQIEIKNVPFTPDQKLKQSFIGGCMSSIFVMSLFAAIFVMAWIYSPAKADFQNIFTILICVGIPTHIMGTVGTFSQLTYVSFLLDRSAKK